METLSHRFQISLTPAVYRRLRHHARASGKSAAQIVREAVEAFLRGGRLAKGSSPASSGLESLVGSIEAKGGLPRDASSRHDDLAWGP